MRFASIAFAVALVSVVGVSRATPDAGLFGLHWGQSAERATEAADAKVLHWSIHQSYGQSFELDRLPEEAGGEINRILYFNDENRLLRIWVNFGNPGGDVWEENYRLDAAIEKYTALKAAYSNPGTPGACEEPTLERVRQEGREVLDTKFPRNQTVWSCLYKDGRTDLELSLRRLGDVKGERFDVVLDAQDTGAVMAYRKKHPLRGRGHGALTRAEGLEEEGVEIDCELAKSRDRSTMDTSPFALLFRRVCDFESMTPEEEEALRRYDEVILLD